MATTKIPKSRAKTAYGLLSEVRALILDEPKRYNQGTWLLRASEGDDKYFPACGTIACVAGWIVTLKAPGVTEPVDIEKRAEDILGVDCGWLFSGGALNPDLVPQTQKHAKAGAKHIATFQKANRAQLLAKKV